MTKRISLIALVLAAALLLGASTRNPQPAAASVRQSTVPVRHAAAAREVTALRQRIAATRARTWKTEASVLLPRTPTEHAERHTRSVAFLRWIDGRWHGFMREARRRAAKIPHVRLWLCIHTGGGYGPGEGAWNDPNSGGNGHFGGLQMSSPWGRGVYYVYRADWLSPYEQMRKAELGYAASGHSESWLIGQWDHPGCVAAYR